MLTDLRLAFRQFAKSPGFTAVVLLTLALGIGANTIVFSLVNSVLLRPLPYPDADRIVMIGSADNDGMFWNGMNLPGAQALFDDADFFEAITVVFPQTWSVRQNGAAQKIDGLGVSSGFLQVYGIQPLLGRDFLPEEDAPGGNNAVTILSHAYWRQAFGADPNIIGQTIELGGAAGGAAHEVIGVLPPNALWQEDVALLTPEFIGNAAWKRDPNIWWLKLTGRLKEGVSVAQASSAMDALLQIVFVGDMEAKRWKYSVMPLRDFLIRFNRDSIPLLLGGVVLLLLVACANVANLLLARATARRKEFAVRAALGAGRTRLLRQILTESVVLALLGGGLGLLVASFGVDLMALALPAKLPGVLNPELDGRVLGVAILVAVGTGVGVGLIPAWRAWRADVNRDLTEAGRGSTAGGRSRIQSLLVVAEVALTVILLVGTGYLLRSYANTLQADPGFDADNVIVGRISPDVNKLGTLVDGNPVPALVEFHRALRREMASLPGVVSVATAYNSPFDGREGGQRIRPSDKPDFVSVAASRYVGGDYFGTLGIALVRGRLLNEDDDRLEAPTRVLLNEVLAKELFPGEDPIGQQVYFAEKHCEVVGVVGNARQDSMTEKFRSTVYLSHSLDAYNISVLIRAHQFPETLASLMRDAVKRVNPHQAIYEIRTLNAFMRDSISGERVVVLLIGLFGVSALGLACLGIYGVMAYTVEQRRREISIRMALGALARDILQMVMREGFKLGAAGLGLGIIGGMICGRLIHAQLFEVDVMDLSIFASAVGIIAILLCLSLLIPANRAAQNDAVAALRAE
jgi:putative ABC transport system permease protein